MLTKLRILTSALLIFSQVTFFFNQDATAQGRRRTPTDQASKGLQLKLSEGAPAHERPAQAATAPALRLSDSEAENVLKRLRPIKTEAGDQTDFALRDRSLPPPRTGKTITSSFPPPESAEAPSVSTGPLEVLRYSPEGDVPLAPQLSVTFSQPMVAVTSHTDATAESIPVRLTPQPPGRWRWVGTRTLLFEGAGRLPMATEYTAEIPAGTHSATGATLGATKIWKFNTPPLKAKSFFPIEGPASRDPLMFVEFDQRINPSAVVDKMVVRSGNRQWKVRLAASEDVEADEVVRPLAAAATKDRWLAFRIIKPE